MELSRLSPRTAWLIAILIAVLHAWMAVTAVNTKSPTFDEPQHLTAGYSYWVTNDFRLDPENGNLPAMWAALPLLFDDLKFVPLNDRGWQRAEEGRTAHQFFYAVGNDPDQIIAQARVMMSIFGAALCLLVYWIAREFFGPIGGLITTTVAAFDPNFLAHSPLVASDVPAAFFFTATVWSCWRLLQQISPARLALATLSLSGLLLTKFSAPIVLPVLGAMSIWQILSKAEIRLTFGKVRTALMRRAEKARAVIYLWSVLAATVFLAIWCAFSFRFDAWTDHSVHHKGTTWHWDYLLEDKGLFEKTVAFMRDAQLLPEAYLYGFAYVHKHEIDRPAFLDNEWSIVGFRSFFPLAFLYKTSLPLLFLLALAIYAAIATRRSWKIENLFNPLWGFALVYGAFALSAQLNIGHRHLLPIYPTLFVACGAVVYLLRQNRRAIFAGAIALLLCAQIADSFAARPNYLAYFNQIDGGPKNGYQHLLDSSLDWGQDLPALKSWIDNHGAIVDGKPFYLAYFGTADAHYYGIDAKPISQDLSSRGRPPTRLTGGIYFVSATELQSLYAEAIGPWCVQYEDAYLAALAGLREYRSAATTRITPIGNEEASPLARKMKKLEALQIARLFAYLRHRAPIAQISYSMFVFDLSNEELNQALYGPPVELKPSGCVRGL
jgi:Dolichyl-phosphate-mannose-protein mannosyltransferase